MKYIFFGTPKFAAIILEKLIDAGMPPVAIVCNPDRPVGRKKIIASPPVKTVAQKNGSGITILQPEHPKEIIEGLKKIGADVFVVAAYAKIIPEDIIDIPKLGTIGVHPSLLPKYRGATPIQTTLLNGDAGTGTTLFLIDEKVDHGPIISTKEIKIANNETYATLEEKLANLSGELLIKTLPQFLTGKLSPHPQNETDATYTKKFTSEDGFVDVDKEEPLAVERKIRALNPEPGVWMKRNDGKRVKLLGAEIKNNVLHFTKIQVEGEKPHVV